MLVGSAVHEIMEHLHKPGIVRSRALFERAIALVVSDPRYKGVIAKVKKCAEGFWKTYNTDDLHKPTHIEHRVAVPLTEDVELVGVFDDLTLTEDKLMLIGEYKISMQEPDEEAKVWWTAQPLVYQYLATKAFPDYTLMHSQHTLIWPGHATRILRQAYNALDIEDQLISLALRMGNELAIPAYWGGNGFICKRCPFVGRCRRKLRQGTDEVIGEVPDWLFV